jgi:acetolactate synthase-1/2/3 large subunit
VAAFRSGRGIVPDDDPLGITVASAYRLWQDTDLLVGFGTRMELPEWRWPGRPAGLKIVRVDIDPSEMTAFRPDAGIVTNVTAGARAIRTAVQTRIPRREGRRDAVAAARAEVEREIRERVPQIAYLDAVREVLPRDGFLVDEVSQAGFAASYGFPVYMPRTFVSAGFSGTLGAGFPTALGVKVGNPEKQVVSISGDGGFLFCGQELATAVQYGIGVVALVFNNNAYGNVLRDQTNFYKGRILASELVNPDFVKLGEAYGARAARVHSPGELKATLEKAFGEDAPWLIEIPVRPGDEATPWPYIMPVYKPV